MTETRTINTVRFGEIEPSDDRMFVFEDGLVGLPELTRFIAVPHSEESPFVWLQSLDEPEVAFLAVNPCVFVGEYEPTIRPVDAKKIGLENLDAAIVYTFVTIPQGQPNAMTLNLAGPILVNLETRRARQVVLDTDEWSVKHPAFSQDLRAAA